MSQQVSLKEAERRAFQVSHNDGLWDVMLGCFVLVFAIAPLLSDHLGDFWSSMIFLPFWGLVYLAIWLIRRTVVAPRLGTACYSPARKVRLAWFTAVMLVLNAAVLVLGIVAAVNVASTPDLLFPVALALFLLVAFTLAGYLLDMNRLYIYGLLLGLAPLAGEWLFANGYAGHHGYPVTFGVTAAIMIVTGLALFVRLLVRNPVDEGEGLEV